MSAGGALEESSLLLPPPGLSAQVLATSSREPLPLQSPPSTSGKTAQPEESCPKEDALAIYNPARAPAWAGVFPESQSAALVTSDKELERDGADEPSTASDTLTGVHIASQTNIRFDPA